MAVTLPDPPGQEREFTSRAWQLWFRLLKAIIPTGSIVGTTDTQTMTNKTMTLPIISAAKFPEQESAPAAVANAAVVYAQDNGAGKTQLMVRFPTGAAQQISIEP